MTNFRFSFTRILSLLEIAQYSSHCNCTNFFDLLWYQYDGHWYPEKKKEDRKKELIRFRKKIRHKTQFYV